MSVTQQIHFCSNQMWLCYTQHAGTSALSVCTKSQQRLLLFTVCVANFWLLSVKIDSAPAVSFLICLFSCLVYEIGEINTINESIQQDSADLFLLSPVCADRCCWRKDREDRQAAGWMDEWRAAVLLFMWIPSIIGFILSCVNSKCACYDFNTSSFRAP